MRKLVVLTLIGSLLVNAWPAQAGGLVSSHLQAPVVCFTDQALISAALNVRKPLSVGWDRLRRSRILRPLRFLSSQRSFRSARTHFDAYADARGEFAQALVEGNRRTALNRLRALQSAQRKLKRELNRFNLPASSLQPLQEEWGEIRSGYELLRQSSSVMQRLALDEIAAALIRRPVTQDPLSALMESGVELQTLIKPRHAETSNALSIRFSSLGKTFWKPLAASLGILLLLGMAGWTFWASRQAFKASPAGAPQSETRTAESIPRPQTLSQTTSEMPATAASAQQLLAQLEREGQENSKQMQALDKELREQHAANLRRLQDVEKERNNLTLPPALSDPSPGLFSTEQRPNNPGRRMETSSVAGPAASNQPEAPPRIQGMSMADILSHEVVFEFERPVSGYVMFETMTRYSISQDGWIRPEPTLTTTTPLRKPSGAVVNRGAMAVHPGWTVLPRLEGMSLDPDSIQFDQPNIPFDVRRDAEGTVYLLTQSMEENLHASFAYHTGALPEVLKPSAFTLQRMNLLGWEPDTQAMITRARKLSDDGAALLLRAYQNEAMEYSLDAGWDAQQRNPPGQRLANVDRFRTSITTRDHLVRVGECEVGNNLHVGELRDVGVSAVLAMGNHSPLPRQKWTVDTGHAWALYYDRQSNRWKRSDATPPDTDGIESARNPQLPVAQGDPRLRQLDEETAKALSEESRLSRMLEEARAKQDQLDRQKAALKEQLRRLEAQRRNFLLTQRNEAVQQAGKALTDFLRVIQSGSASSPVDLDSLEAWIRALPAGWPADVRQHTAVALWKDVLDWASPAQRPALLERYDRAIQPLFREEDLFRPFVVQAQGEGGPFTPSVAQRWTGGWLPRQQGNLETSDAKTTPFWTGPLAGALPAWIQDEQGAILGFTQDDFLFDLKGHAVGPVWKVGSVDQVVSSPSSLYVVADGKVYKMPSQTPVKLAPGVQKVEQLFADDYGTAFYIGILEDGTKQLFYLNGSQWPIFQTAFTDVSIQRDGRNWVGLIRDVSGTVSSISITGNPSGLYNAGTNVVTQPEIVNADLSTVQIVQNEGTLYYVKADASGLRLYIDGDEMLLNEGPTHLKNFRYVGGSDPVLRMDIGFYLAGNPQDPSQLEWRSLGIHLKSTPTAPRGPDLDPLPAEPMAQNENGRAFAKHQPDGTVSLIFQPKYYKEDIVLDPMEIDLNSVRVVRSGLYFLAKDPQTGRMRMAHLNEEAAHRFQFISNPEALSLSAIESWPGAQDVFAERYADGWRWREHHGRALFPFRRSISIPWKGHTALIVLFDNLILNETAGRQKTSSLWLLADGQWQDVTPAGVNTIYYLTLIKGQLFFSGYPEIEEAADVKESLNERFWLWNGQTGSESRAVPVSPADLDLSTVWSGIKDQDAWLVFGNDRASAQSVMHPNVVQPLPASYLFLDNEGAMTVDEVSDITYLRYRGPKGTYSWKALSSESVKPPPINNGWAYMWFDGHGHRYGLRATEKKGRWALVNEQEETLAIVPEAKPSNDSSYLVPYATPDGTFLLPIVDEDEERIRLYALREGKLVSQQGPYATDQIAYAGTHQGALIVDGKAGEEAIKGVPLSESVFKWRGEAGLTWIYGASSYAIPEAIGSWTPTNLRSSRAISPQQLLLLRSENGQALLLQDPIRMLRDVFQELLGQSPYLKTPAVRDAWSALRNDALARYRNVMGPNPSTEDRLLAALLALGGGEESYWLDQLRPALTDPVQRDKARAALVHLMHDQWERLTADHEAPFMPASADDTAWQRLWNTALRDAVHRPFPLRLFGTAPKEFLAHDATVRGFLERYPELAPTQADWNTFHRPVAGLVAREMTHQVSFWLLMIPFMGALLSFGVESLRARTYRLRIHLLSGWALEIHREAFERVSFQKALFDLDASLGLEAPRTWGRHIGESLFLVPAFLSLTREWRTSREWKDLLRQGTQSLHPDRLPIWVLINQAIDRMPRSSQQIKAAA